MGHPIDHYSKIKKELVPSDDPEVREEISESKKPCQPETNKWSAISVSWGKEYFS
jgi:hypothetical protein